AKRTWESIASMTQPETGWPADKIFWSPEDGQEGCNKNFYTDYQTSPTNIGLNFFNFLAAARLGFVTPDFARAKTLNALTTLEKAHKQGQTVQGFYLNWYDSRTGELLKVWPKTGRRTNQFVSTVDNGWLAAGITGVVQAYQDDQEITGLAQAILGRMDFGKLYNLYKNTPEQPWCRHPGQLHGGARVNRKQQTMRLSRWHYGAITEARIASYVGIARGDLPGEHYFRLYRTLPPEWKQQQKPEGHIVTYEINDIPVEVFEGHYSYKNGGAPIEFVPPWNGGMFETMMPSMVVPEAQWGAGSWGINLRNFVLAQISHGLASPYGVWGYSPASNPRGYFEGKDGYGAWGVAELGMDPRKAGKKEPPRDEVVAPHASFLALEIAPREALSNLEKLREEYGLFGPYGFYDSVCPATRKIAYSHLVLDQSMCLLPMVNYLCDGYVRNLLKAQLEPAIKPLLEKEVFSIKLAGS
ncbi:MAG: hypothetical protein UT01_C0006G0001, partial [Candidatus Daviesbacteria bacterium GW2011_GWA1_38_7]